MAVCNKSHWTDTYRYVGRDLKLFWDKNGGKICTVAGTAGMAFFGAHACRKTYKIHDKLAENGRRMAEAKGKKAKAKVFISSVVDVTKDYLPDIVGATVSGYAISKGWQKEHQNYEKAAVGFGVLAAEFMNYRQNVISEHGKEADRKYLTTKHEKKKVLEATMNDGTKLQSNGQNSNENEGITVNVEPNMLKIWYSRETTPQVWSNSHVIRLHHLEDIRRKLEQLLMYGGHYSVNDVRREFYGVKGDIAAGGLFGRVWDPGNPEHPERGAMVNLHYEEDEDFMSGLTDSCWIIIDIDDEPLIESLAIKSISDIPGIEIGREY